MIVAVTVVSSHHSLAKQQAAGVLFDRVPPCPGNTPGTTTVAMMHKMMVASRVILIDKENKHQRVCLLQLQCFKPDVMFIIKMFTDYLGVE